MLGTYAASPTPGWGVIVQVEEDKAYYSAIQMRYQSLALVALVTVAAIVVRHAVRGPASATPSRTWPAAPAAWPAATTPRAST